MLLNLAFLLALWPVIISVPSTPEQPYFVSTTVPVTGGQSAKENETDNGINGAELGMEHERPLVEDDYSNEWRPTIYDYPGSDSEEENGPQMNYNYPNYEDEEHDLGDEFDKEWMNAGAMKISLIGRYDPNSRPEEISKREASVQDSVLNRRHKRDSRRWFDKTSGCNKLPVAPANSMGTCHHTDSVAKCRVVCHKFNRYPDESRQKTYFCLDGYWEPEKLPDCKPQIQCVDVDISGKNMNVSCIEDNEVTNCTAICEGGSTFPDKETFKIIECENRISYTKFPDCSFD